MVTPDSIPKRSPLPKRRKAFGSRVTGEPRVRIRQRPRYKKEVARVMMSELIRVK